VTDGSTEKRDGIDAELARPRRRFHGKEVRSQDGVEDPTRESEIPNDESKEPISSLIVCTKTPQVLQALSAVKHRLNKESVVLFLQNGMGIVDEVNKEIFADPETRPHYMLGINSHAVHGHPDNPFTAVHAGFGTISLGILPPERDRESAPYTPGSQFRPGLAVPVDPKHAAKPISESADPKVATFKWTSYDRYLLRTLLRSPILCGTAFSPPDLLQMQLEKLAVNCIINPLTVMLDARNGSVLYNYAMTRTMRLLLAEISLVIRSLPELQYIPNVSQRFDPGRLETIAVSTAHRTRDNISSMLADVRKGRITEIDYMNGWIVKKGEEQGVRCLMNYMMLNLVKGKANMIQMEMGEDVPFLDSKPGESGVEIKGEGGVEIKGEGGVDIKGEGVERKVSEDSPTS
jgi:2-dehydropantoate 2-reductase